jgi:hypothetical protein
MARLADTDSWVAILEPDLLICRRLAELYRRAGLRDIGIETSLGS